MRINEMTLTPPIYNPETGAFEADARLTEAGTVFSYRVSHVSAPHAEFDAVSRGLKGQALMQHRHSKERTQRLIRDTVRAATSRANSPMVGAFLAA